MTKTLWKTLQGVEQRDPCRWACVLTVWSTDCCSHIYETGVSNGLGDSIVGWQLLYPTHYRQSPGPATMLQTPRSVSGLSPMVCPWLARVASLLRPPPARYLLCFRPPLRPFPSSFEPVRAGEKVWRPNPS